MASSVLCFCVGAGAALVSYSSLFNTKCINSNDKEKRYLINYDGCYVNNDGSLIVPDDFVNGFYFVGRYLEHIVQLCLVCLCFVINLTLFFFSLDDLDGGFPCNASSTPSTRELARTLNMMDDSFISWPVNKQRWDVIEDSKALYILRYMTGLTIKDVTEHVEFPSVDKGISTFIIYLMHYK